jgi:hypothetical protein
MAEKTPETAPAAEYADAPVDGSVSEKLAWIQSHVHHVEKTGQVSFGSTKFSHMQEHGIYQVLRPLLRAVGCAIEPPDVIEWRREGNSTIVIWETGLRDGKTGDTITKRYIGEGVDNSDKGPYKAMTGANKYALQKFFAIPTEEIDEPEGSDESHNTVREAPAGAGESPRMAQSQVQALREAAAAAVKEKKLTNPKVKARLQTEYSVDKIEELTPAQGADFAEWLAQQIKGQS